VRRGLLPAALVLAALVLAAPAAHGQKWGRVTVITDSVGGVFYWSAAARNRLGYELDVDLETKTCRKLVVTGCWAYGEYPPSALETIEALGPELGPVVVIDVGYNDVAEGYGDGLDRVMRALLDEGAQRVVWVTLEETQDTWAQINAQIRLAPLRWPQLVVADWAPVAAGQPWLVDDAHMNEAGAQAFSEFLRPIVYEVCRGLCTPADPDFDRFVFGLIAE
jgi:hypothetical protein